MQKETVMGRISDVCEQYNCILKQDKNSHYYIDNDKFRIYFLNYKEWKNGQYLKNGKAVYNIYFDIAVKEKIDGNKKGVVWVEKGRTHLQANTIPDNLEDKTKQVINHLYNLGYLGVSADNLKIDTDKEFERIAQEVLDIETLKIRDSNNLNFHSVSVWDIKQAFQKVFDLGVDVGYSINR